MLKALNISNTVLQAPPDLLKVQAILLHMTVRRSAVKREDLKPKQKSERRLHF